MRKGKRLRKNKLDFFMIISEYKATSSRGNSNFLSVKSILSSSSMICLEITNLAFPSKHRWMNLYGFPRQNKAEM
jgi:hypothetical protein